MQIRPISGIQNVNCSAWRRYALCLVLFSNDIALARCRVTTTFMQIPLEMYFSAIPGRKQIHNFVVMDQFVFSSIAFPFKFSLPRCGTPLKSLVSYSNKPIFLVFFCCCCLSISQAFPEKIMKPIPCDNFIAPSAGN